MSAPTATRLRYALAAIFTAAAIYSGVQVIHVDSNMEQVTRNFEGDRAAR